MNWNTKKQHWIHKAHAEMSHSQWMAAKKVQQSLNVMEMTVIMVCEYVCMFVCVMTTHETIMRTFHFAQPCTAIAEWHGFWNVHEGLALDEIFIHFKMG